MLKREGGNMNKIVLNDTMALVLDVADCMSDLCTKNFTLMVHEILQNYPDCRPVIRIAVRRKKVKMKIWA